MARYLRDIMTQRPVTLQATDTVVAAARSMRDGNIGDVVVLEQRPDPGNPDRSGHRGPGPGGGAGSGPDDRRRDLQPRADHAVSPTDAIGDAEKIMRDRAIRRLPVVEGGRPVGIVSLGDLAVERNPESTLGGISAAPPNR